MHSSIGNLNKISFIIAPLLLVSVLTTPALASQTGPAATPSETSSTKPNVGDAAPTGFGIKEEENFLTDEDGLIALGIAALIGAGTAFLVVRVRRKSSIY